MTPPYQQIYERLSVERFSLYIDQLTIWDLFIITSSLAFIIPEVLRKKRSLDFFYEVPQKNVVSKEPKDASKEGSRNFNDWLRDADARMVIFWGSEGGTAERFVHRLAGDIEARYRIKIVTADLAGFDHHHLVDFPKDKTVGFIVFTYGEGDPPGNTNGLWQTLASLRKQSNKSGNPAFAGLQYFIFGLGNSNYQWYNRASEVINQSLLDLGAQRIGTYGKANDCNGGTEEDFLSWKQDILASLQEALQLEEQARSYVPTAEIAYLDLSQINDPSKVYHGEPDSSLLPQSSSNRQGLYDIFIAPVANARMLYTAESRSCLHIELVLDQLPRIKYQTGDHLAVWPSAPDAEVEQLAKLLGLKGRFSSAISIRSTSEILSGGSHSHLPSPTTIEALFRHYLEISAPLSRDFLGDLVEFSPSTAAKERISALADDRTRFQSEVLNQKLTLAGFLTRIDPSQQKWEIPLSFLIERLRKTQPRRYSISSSAATHPRRPSLTIAIDHKYRNNISHQCEGLATNYLLSVREALQQPTKPSLHYLTGPRDLLSGGKVFAQIRQNTFRLPPKSTTPIILIGTGTGVAPLRGFMQERTRVAQFGKPMGKTIAILGFRSSQEFYYEEDWYQFRGVLGSSLELWTTFSREKRHSSPIYVQDQIREKSNDILRLLEEDRCSIYICGQAVMSREVVGLLKQIWSEKYEKQSTDADEWIHSLKSSSRLQEDVWG